MEKERKRKIQEKAHHTEAKEKSLPLFFPIFAFRSKTVSPVITRRGFFSVLESRCRLTENPVPERSFSSNSEAFNATSFELLDVYALVLVLVALFVYIFRLMLHG